LRGALIVVFDSRPGLVPFPTGQLQMLAYVYCLFTSYLLVIWFLCWSDHRSDYFLVFTLWIWKFSDLGFSVYVESLVSWVDWIPHAVSLLGCMFISPTFNMLSCAFSCALLYYWLWFRGLLVIADSSADFDVMHSFLHVVWTVISLQFEKCYFFFHLTAIQIPRLPLFPI